MASSKTGRARLECILNFYGLPEREKVVGEKAEGQRERFCFLRLQALQHFKKRLLTFIPLKLFQNNKGYGSCEL